MCTGSSATACLSNNRVHVGTSQSNLSTRQPEIVDSTEKFSFLPLCFAVTVHELRKSSTGFKFDVNLLKLRRFWSSFVISHLCEGVAHFHNFKFDKAWRDVSNESLELACKKRQHVFTRVQVCWDTNATSLSLQTTNLAREPPLELGSFLSIVFTYTVIFGNTL